MLENNNQPNHQEVLNNQAEPQDVQNGININNPNVAERQIDALTSKISVPTLCKDQIETWFIQLECWFSLYKISADKVKFNTVVAAMDTKTLTQVFSAVQSPPEENKYNNLKNQIIAAYSDSAQQRFQKLLSGIQLGDKRPSHLLNEFKKVGGDMPSELLKNLWISRLPTQAKTILSASSATIEELARIADAVVDSITFSTASISEVNLASPNNVAEQHSEDFPSLQRQIMELQKKFEFLSKNRSRSNPRDTKNSRKRDKTPSKKSEICWYHQKFGNSAHKCIKPCNFSSE